MAALPAPTYVIEPTTLAPGPWGDAPRDWPLLGETVGARVRRELGAAGLREAPDGLRLPDTLLVTAGFVRGFLEGARGTTGPAVAALGPSLAADRCRARSWLGEVPAPDGALRVPLVVAPGDGRSALEIARDPATAVVVVDPEEQSKGVPTPRVYAEPGSDGITFSGCAHVSLDLTHRTHLLQANLDLLGSEFLALQGSKAKLALRYLWGRLTPGRTLLSRVGTGCTIHPTAVVEACRIGDGVEIGAYAVVRGSVIGDGATIEDGAHVHVSVLGERARVARQTAIFLCLLMEGAHSAQAVMQTCVLGRHSATVSDTWFLDVRVGSVEPGDDGLLPGRSFPVFVEAGEGHPREGTFVDSGSRLLGCTVGHETMVAAGVVVAPGRSLPNRATIVGPKDYLLARTALDEDAPHEGGGGIFRVEEGRLERVDG